MSLTPFMHPRNPYKTPPSFKQLAADFEEFRDVVTFDLKGKVHVNFKDPNVLRALSKCCMKRDFDLDVEIPSDRLVPTLPLRLNYLLWIEDLLNGAGIDQGRPVLGLDIGAGASCVFPLIGARKFGWHWIGTEAVEDSAACAENNVKKNNLQDSIKIVRTEANEQVLDPVFQSIPEDSVVDFMMCNPPFFDTAKPDQEEGESEHEGGRKRARPRPSPKNADTGSEEEKSTKGGEVSFVGKLVEESKKYKDRVRIFTTMVGTKLHLIEIRTIVKDCGAKTVVEAEFCQGNTMRWGVGWSFGDDLEKAVAAGVKGTFRPKKQPARSPNRSLRNLPSGEEGDRKQGGSSEAKSKLVGTWELPEDRSYDCNILKIASIVEGFLKDIQVAFKVISSSLGWHTLEVSSSTGRLPNIRKMRRAMNRKDSASDHGETPTSDQEKSQGDTVVRARLSLTSISHADGEGDGPKKGVQLKCTTEFADIDKCPAAANFSLNLFQVMKNLLSGVYDPKSDQAAS